MAKVIYEYSAGAVVFYMEDINTRYYLLLHYPSGHWDFPKGVVEEGEDELETAYREVYEETGIPRDKLILIKGFQEYVRYRFYSHGNIVKKTVVFFLMRSLTMDVKLSWEHRDYKWLPFPEALQQTTFKTGKDLLMKAERYIRELISEGKITV